MEKEARWNLAQAISFAWNNFLSYTFELRFILQNLDQILPPELNLSWFVKFFSMPSWQLIQDHGALFIDYKFFLCSSDDVPFKFSGSLFCRIHAFVEACSKFFILCHFVSQFYNFYWVLFYSLSLAWSFLCFHYIFLLILKHNYF